MVSLKSLRNRLGVLEVALEYEIFQLRGRARAISAGVRSQGLSHFDHAVLLGIGQQISHLEIEQRTIATVIRMATTRPPKKKRRRAA